MLVSTEMQEHAWWGSCTEAVERALVLESITPLRPDVAKAPGGDHAPPAPLKSFEKEQTVMQF